MIVLNVISSLMGRSPTRPNEWMIAFFLKKQINTKIISLRF